MFAPLHTPFVHEFICLVGQRFLNPVFLSTYICWILLQFSGRCIFFSFFSAGHAVMGFIRHSSWHIDFFFMLFLQFHRYIITGNGIQSPMRRCIFVIQVNVIMCHDLARSFSLGSSKLTRKNGLFHYFFLSSVLLLYVDVRVAKRGIKKAFFFFYRQNKFHTLFNSKHFKLSSSICHSN